MLPRTSRRERLGVNATECTAGPYHATAYVAAAATGDMYSLRAREQVRSSLEPLGVRGPRACRNDNEAVAPHCPPVFLTPHFYLTRRHAQVLSQQLGLDAEEPISAGGR